MQQICRTNANTATLNLPIWRLTEYQDIEGVAMWAKRMLTLWPDYPVVNAVVTMRTFRMISSDTGKRQPVSPGDEQQPRCFVEHKTLPSPLAVGHCRRFRATKRYRKNCSKQDIACTPAPRDEFTTACVAGDLP